MDLADDGPDGVVARLTAVGHAGPVYIADGHHRYETALRYRDERRMTRSCEPDPPFDFILALLLDADEPLTVLPTHRVVRGLGEDGDRRAPRRRWTACSRSPRRPSRRCWNGSRRRACWPEARGGSGS